VYSREALLEQCDGDEELMAKLISRFHENTPRILETIRKSIAQADASALAQAAHKLLSSLGAFGAQRARALAAHLEEQGQLHDLDGARERYGELEQEIDKIYAALAGFALAIV
ncbi:MAG: Hpt domain-containing protein, partial [Verrucomicrobiota bacterium]|nr:Hpt domain-containing protein [Verrucomicrobiota bacterium]